MVDCYSCGSPYRGDYFCCPICRRDYEWSYTNWLKKQKEVKEQVEFELGEGT